MLFDSFFPFFHSRQKVRFRYSCQIIFAASYFLSYEAEPVPVTYLFYPPYRILKNEKYGVFHSLYKSIMPHRHNWSIKKHLQLFCYSTDFIHAGIFLNFILYVLLCIQSIYTHRKDAERKIYKNPVLYYVSKFDPNPMPNLLVVLNPIIHFFGKKSSQILFLLKIREKYAQFV